MNNQGSSGSGSPNINGDHNIVNVNIYNATFQDNVLNPNATPMIYPNAKKADVTSTASSMSITFNAVPIGLDSFGLAIPMSQTESFIRKLPMERGETMLALVRGLRESIARVIDAADKKKGALAILGRPYGGIVTEEIVKSWHERLNDIERLYSPKH